MVNVKSENKGARIEVEGSREEIFMDLQIILDGMADILEKITPFPTDKEKSITALVNCYFASLGEGLFDSADRYSIDLSKLKNAAENRRGKDND